MKLRTFLLVISSLCTSACAVAQTDCPYLPEFQPLRKQLETLAARDAVTALQKYVLEHENPEGCELAEIDRLLQERETKLIKLRVGKDETAAQVVYRCNDLNPTTAQCRSPMEDGTAQPLSAGLMPMPSPAVGSAYRVVSAIPSSELIGLYQINLSDALDGKAAKHLGKDGSGKWSRPRRSGNIALIAIYKSQGPWAYRKAVWYFE